MKTRVVEDVYEDFAMNNLMSEKGFRINEEMMDSNKKIFAQNFFFRLAITPSETRGKCLTDNEPKASAEMEKVN